MVDCKVVLLEFLTKQDVNSDNVEEDILKEFQAYDKDLIFLTYKVLLEKFNEKYDSISPEQKQILKEFINSVDSTPELRNFYNTKIAELKEHLSKSTKTIQDPATKVKVEEIAKQLVELDKTAKVNDDHLVDLMQYYELVQEIKKANGVQI
jgi:TRAP-type C4-dicarboxylate transport system substrate-binding protein